MCSSVGGGGEKAEDMVLVEVGDLKNLEKHFQS